MPGNFFNGKLIRRFHLISLDKLNKLTESLSRLIGCANSFSQVDDFATGAVWFL
jgi:hypothetical protein